MVSVSARECGMELYTGLILYYFEKMKFLIIAMLLQIPIQLFAQSFEPGLWKSKESLELNGVSLPDFKAEECITPSQAKDSKATIEKELKRRGCSLTKWMVKDQKLDGLAACVAFAALDAHVEALERRTQRIGARREILE